MKDLWKWIAGALLAVIPTLYGLDTWVAAKISQEAPYVQDRKLILYRLERIETVLKELVLRLRK